MIHTKLIPSILKEIEEQMHKEEYSNHSISKVLNSINQFYDFLLMNEVEIMDLETVDSYLNSLGIFNLKPKSRKDYNNTRPLFILINYVFKHEISYQANINFLFQKKSKFNNLLEKYKEQLRTTDISESYLCKRLYIFKQFIQYIENNNIENLEEITKDFCYSFISEQNYQSISYKRDSIYRFRCLLNWLHQEQCIAFSGIDAFPRLISLHDTKIPQYYDKDEVKSILDNIDTSTPTGKRTYSMLTLFVFYGLRRSDVLNLKFNDIHWDKNTITISQIKTKIPLVLPLIDEVRYPLIDYIKNARPKCDSPYIFIKHTKPNVKLVHANTRYYVKKAIEKAGISLDNRSICCHIFRFSLANSLLNDEIQMPIISNILGHSSLDTTNLYLSVDTQSLRMLSLEVPPCHTMI